MKIVEKKEIVENNITYVVEIYDTGHIVKTAKPSETPPKPEALQPTQLDRIEEAVNAIANSENSEAVNALLGG